MSLREIILYAITQREELNQMNKKDTVTVKIIQDLIKACGSLMNELSQVQATDWGIVNDALVAGERYVRTCYKKENDEKR